MLHEWTLIDVEAERYVEEWNYDGQRHDWPALNISMRRLRGGVQDGVERITVTDGDFSFDVLPTRGMSLHAARLGDWRIGWQSPVRGPVHPKYVPVTEPNGLGWLSGFDELLVRCGLESNGAPDFNDKNQLTHPLHGRIGNLPARKVSVAVDTEAQTVSITGVIDECRFHFIKLELTATVTLKKGRKALVIDDVIRNRSAGPAEAQMLYHTNFGAPLLDGGAQVVAAVKKVVPRNDHAAGSVEQWSRYPAPTPGVEEQVYFLDLIPDSDGRASVMLKDAHGTRAAIVRHSLAQLPCFSQWKNPTALEDGYVTGLEPGTNFPNPRSFEGEHRRVIELAPGASKALRLELQFLNQEQAIAQAEAQINSLQTGEPVLLNAPDPNWCAGVTEESNAE